MLPKAVNLLCQFELLVHLQFGHLFVTTLMLLTLAHATRQTAL